jgi:hypothetical protein
MLDLGFEGERERRRERERNKWVREKKRRRSRLGQSWLRSFILVFTNRITDEILNINMLLVILFVKSNWYLGPFYQKKSQMKN